MIPIGELASLQATAANALSISCTIKRKNGSPDGYLGRDGTEYSVTTVNVGMSQPTPGQMLQYANKIGALRSWQVRFPYGTDVQENDHLYIGSEVLTVQAIVEPRSYPTVTLALASVVE